MTETEWPFCPVCADSWASHCRTCKRCHAPGRINQLACGCTAQAPKRTKSTGANLWNGPMKRDPSTWRH